MAGYAPREAVVPWRHPRKRPRYNFPPAALTTRCTFFSGETQRRSVGCGAGSYEVTSDIIDIWRAEADERENYTYAIAL